MTQKYWTDLARPVFFWRLFPRCCCLALALCCITFCLNAPAAGGEGAKPANRLSREKSPYLLKHATNPVDWYPWGEEAFAKARQEDKPVFLSIGYSTCHWCNVMEEESFANPEVAARLNEVFVAVKVDREERPDIDRTYMQACQMLSPNCGWPLTIFMTPDKKPFYAGSYFPREGRFGRPGLKEMIDRVQTLWKQERQGLLDSADSVVLAMQKETFTGPQQQLGRPQFDAAYDEDLGLFDQEYGGFGRGQKFPRPHNLLFLLRYWQRTGKAPALAMVEKTLTAMRQGAIFDQLGYGFHRYTTDRQWRQPHFEKMLVDQALLMLAYTEAYQATGKELYGRTAREIAEYVLAGMQAPGGGFYTAESADSQGEEGRYYLWQEADIRKVLTPAAAADALRIFHVTGPGNFAEAAGGGAAGANVLFLEEGGRLPAGFDDIRQKLLQARQQRPRPERDDKVLTDWNGLMIAALAKAAQVFDKPEFGAAAGRAADFLLRKLQGGDGRLLHRWRDGEAGVAATADDYAFLIWGLLELYGWEFESDRLDTALKLANEMVRLFWDAKEGGFFLTAAQDSQPLLRFKALDELMLPSANGVALLDLLKLSRLTGAADLEEKAGRLVASLSSKVIKRPAQFPMLLSGIVYADGPSQEIVVVGRPGADDTTAMLRALRRQFLPGAVVLFKPADQAEPPILKYAPFMEFMSVLNNKATAYVCTNFQCAFPTNKIETMLELLAGKSAGK